MTGEKGQSRARELALDTERTKPRFLSEPGMDKAVSAIMRLAMEISVLRDRLDTHEALAERTGAYTAADIEEFTPDPARAAQRAERRAALIEGLLHDLR